MTTLVTGDGKIPVGAIVYFAGVFVPLQWQHRAVEWVRVRIFRCRPRLRRLREHVVMSSNGTVLTYRPHMVKQRPFYPA